MIHYILGRELNEDYPKVATEIFKVYNKTMLILLLFAFISGLVTIAAPCIWPLLPIILSASTSGGHRKPLGITLGIITSFAFFTLTLSYILKIIPFDPDILRIFAVIVIGFLGLTLVIPKLSGLLEGWVSRLSGRFVSGGSTQGNGFKSGYITGFSLGLVWSPCAGPILATIATLAATQSLNWQIILVTMVYVIGVGIPLFIFATAGSYFFTKTRLLSPYTGRIQQIFGVIMILTALAIFTGYDRTLQAKLLDSIPAYSNFLYKLEGNPEVQKQLNQLKNTQVEMPQNTVFTPIEGMDNPGSLPNYGKAPEVVGIFRWLNSDPLTLSGLQGKVVLIDFWTYTCINCIRTLPYVTSWYEKYKDKGFVVIGVHTPEFEFEKKTDNVLNAIKQYKITYPVAQDNDYLTWRAYNNHYWPAEYLIDAKGNIRYFHFGEGEYDKTEIAIQKLLEEIGMNENMPLVNPYAPKPISKLTPETYLSKSRRQGYGNIWTLSGKWDEQDEYIEAKENASLDFKFNAAKVFLVITPATKSDVIKVSVDGKSAQTITADTSRLYTLVELPETGTHQLHLDFRTPDTKIYAFTFGD